MTSHLAKYPFEPYWPEKKLKICITGAGGMVLLMVIFNQAEDQSD